MTTQLTDPEAVVDGILAAVGKRVVLALPLGLGKANHIANALYRRAARDPSLELHIFTALTLEAPSGKSELETRFLRPFVERLYKGYPQLDYVAAVRRNALPPNITVNEFFFQAGRWLGNVTAQRSYIATNYTHAVGYLLARGVNVVAQLVAKKGERYSLSCNPDLTLDLLAARHEGRANFVLVGEVNSELPFMPHDADLPAETFSYILDSPQTDFPLFSAPKEPLSLTEHAIGLHIARLIADGGSLQIGIGSEGDAAVNAMILRHRDNATFNEAIVRLTQNAPPLTIEERRPFADGLYGVSEMLVDGFLHLLDAGILKRAVDGIVLHGGFFVGPKSFYQRLREMPDEQLNRICMTRISFTNQLYGDEERKKAARVKARFVNNAMMATALGAIVSDGLEDGRVVSGVGGQFNFVEQALALPGARAILALRATRGARAAAQSNIRWSYGHTTVPRHYRDIVVTEYGIADLRGKADEDVVAAMLSITDSRFQDELLYSARSAGKVGPHYAIPPAYRDNHPERVAQALAPLRENGQLPPFPFGSDFTAAEQRLLPALGLLQGASPRELVGYAMAGFSPAPDEAEPLARLKLKRPRSFSDRFYRALVRGALKTTEPQ